MSQRTSQLQDWEVALIRRMLATGKFTKQEIVAYFTRPDRSINQGRISEIEQDHERYRGIEPASEEELEKFLADWDKLRFPESPILPLGPTHPTTLTTLFTLKDGDPPRLSVSETTFVEGKQSFNWGSKSDYCRTLSGMANNSGGYLIFGVKDGSFEIEGIAQDRMERFDLKRANEFITRSFSQALDLEKGQFQIDEKTVGVIYVHPSKNKPVICKLDADGLNSGDIYYRYPGETRRIQAPELEQLLRERDTSAEGRLLGLLSKVTESGINNAAVINLTSGEVTGEGGRFVIDESLLDKVKFIAQGKFDEREGAPTLRLVGDVQPTSGTVTIQQSVIASITERDIHEAFLLQKCKYKPEAYIQAQTHLQPLWLPIYWFAVAGGLNLDSVQILLKESQSPYESRIQRQIERVTTGRSPAGAPSQQTVARELGALVGADAIEVEDGEQAKRYLQALRLVEPDQMALDRVLKILIDLRSRFGNRQELITEFRYALATIDLRWFGPRVVRLVSEGQSPP